jgi:2-succinyl-5-enolpyruvyl-6-hydroxy-3-cyclohexene-1-carboxylate synthase
MMTATDSYLLLRAFVDELARCGLRHACTSPGSRSTPIVASLAREERVACWSHIDERCAGFFALGAAKASGRPVVVTCTSGTAAANLTPAVIEAREARVPLIVLTADRPPEAREVGAGQTIDQIKLYGGAAKWFFELGIHDARPEHVRWIRTLACRTYWTALGGRPGPVHINIPLREPLVLDGLLPADPSPGRPGRRPWVSLAAQISAPPTTNLDLPARGIVIAGREERYPSLGAEAARFAELAGYPLLADPLSGARHGPAAIARYDVLLRIEALRERFEPELVIRIGDLPTSKPLRSWLDSLTGARQIALDPEGAWQDPGSTVAEIHTGDPVDALTRWAPAAPADPEWLAAWRAAEDRADAAITKTLGEELSEPVVAASLGEWLPEEATLFVASSMPIRDVELFFPDRESARVLSNRGANGIDGTVSSAFGVAAAAVGPVVLLIGDIALAHDIGGLLAARRTGLPLTIVLLNNDGGGIFSFLPVAGEVDFFDEHVATPHGLDFKLAATFYGCRHERVDTAVGLHGALIRGLSSPDTTIIEVRTGREENHALHRRVEDAVRAALMD